MCMKNVNLTIISADILGNMDRKTISLGDIDKAHFYQSVNGQRKIIGSLSLALFMQAMQPKNETQLSKINPAEKLLFSENYRLKIRLTESKSGKAIDLEEFDLCPEDKAFKECVCCDTFKYTRFCLFDNISLPHQKDGEFFVVKVLIKHITGDKAIDDQTSWTVQTVYPLTLTEQKDI